MKKQLTNAQRLQLACPLLLAAAFYTGHAQADVKMYGLLDVYTGVKKTPGDPRTNNVVNNGGMTTSYLGLGGTENIDGDLKVSFAIEAFFRMDTGEIGRFEGDLPFARNAFLGAGNKYGEIRVGRNTTPYFLSTVQFNSFGDSYNFSPMVMHTYTGNFRNGKAGIAGLTGDSGWSNSVRYITPNDMGGFNASLIYSLGEQGSNTSQDKWGGNIGYSSNTFSATAAFQQVKLSGDPSFSTKFVSGYTKQDAAQIGLAYDFSVVKLFGQYQYIKNHITSGDTESQGGQLGVSIPIKAGKLLASYMYTRTTGEDDFKDVKRNSWGLGYDYFLSKRTDVYVAYFNDDVTGLSDGYTAGVGIRTRY